MHKINPDKAEMLTDAVQSYGSLMLDAIVVPGKELGGASLDFFQLVKTSTNVGLS